MEKPIDLTDFVKGKKIPSHLLEHKSKQVKSVSALRVLMAYSLDLFMICSAATMITSIFKLSLATFVISDRLLDYFHKIEFEVLAFQLFPLMSVSYFFFSFLFNEGQTWGMHQLKIRLQIENFNFQAALRWAIFSSMTIMSFGLTYPLAYRVMKTKTQNSFEGHDYLYEALMTERQLSPIHLLSKIEENNSIQVIELQVEEYFDKAA
jgi:hypothetical protein